MREFTPKIHDQIYFSEIACSFSVKIRKTWPKVVKKKEEEEEQKPAK